MTYAFERLSDCVRHFARSQPLTPAARFAEASWSYADLDELVDRCARALLACGLRPGDRVAMLSTPRPEVLVILLASARVGLVWAGINPRYTAAELSHIVADSRPGLILRLASIDAMPLERALGLLAARSVPLPRVVEFGGQGSRGSLACAGNDLTDSLATLLAIGKGGDCPDELAQREAMVEPRAPAMLVYTSGSTGQSKGALISHFGLAAGSAIQCRHFGVRHPRVICNLPISHVGAIADICGTTIVAGGTIVFQEKFQPEEVIEAIERERISIWTGVPTMFQMTLERCALAGKDLSSVELILWGGAAMPRTLVTTLRRFAPRLMTAYGMTETSCHVSFTDGAATDEELAHTVGRVDATIAWRIADSNGEPCAPGVPGELQLRAPTNFIGYLEKPDATREAFTADGWLRTGDVASANDEGNIKLVGRIREMFKSGGYNVYPREIEATLEELPGVALAAVVEVEDARFGQVGHAYVQPVEGVELQAATLIAGLRARLSGYKIPKHISIDSALPLLPIGKVDKQQLRSRSPN